MTISKYEKMIDNAEAIASVFNNVQDQRSQVAQFAIQKAASYLQDNRYDDAVVQFNKALSFDPQNTTALSYKGKIFLSQGKIREAIQAFKDVVRIQPNSAQARIDLGNAYLQDKQYVESEKQFKTAARIDPRNPLGDYTLGLQYSATDRLAEAETQFKKVATISPKDGNVYYALGLVYNKMGRSGDAVANLEKALQLKPNFPAANYELGVAYEATGNRDKALEQLKILNGKDFNLAVDLGRVLNKPRIVSMDTSKSGGFVELLGPGTPLWALDPALISPDSSKVFSVTMQFNNEMDLSSVTNPLNWSITRGKDAKAGYYNNSMPTSSNEANIMKMPLSVSYNSLTRQATVNFRISQNAAGTAQLDPSHLVFKFSGKDASGRTMDTTADQIDGYSIKPF
jgi:tetratricopeptide (TPR) repeat protein